ncbi:Mitochondrial import receptor subunit TOM70-like protein [Leptotrombidium deliense]|uniref:Mitochondrial import receptor subunit TOM70-like protein n=1 Tax=Leptotrombidium deliense TaxID=299467 RepID=A0A443S838_9ACAR|nr:Mitochondrial import receptor subunit TOM70-like protein [Leptotrombidium deliense]
MAIDHYTKAIAYCGNNENYFCAMFHDNRAAAYKKLNDLTNFYKDCNAAIEYDKTFKKAFRRRARLRCKVDDLEAAVRDFTFVCLLEEYKDKESTDAMEKACVKVSQKFTDEMFVEKRCIPNSVLYVNRKYFRDFNRHPFYRKFEILNNLESDLLTLQHLLSSYHYFRNDSSLLSDDPKNVPSKSIFFILKATLNILSEHYSTAEAQLEEIIDMYKNKPPETTVLSDIVIHAFICLANIKGRRLMIEGYGIEYALQCYERALLCDNENEDIYFHRAKFYLECGQLNHSINDFKKSVQYGIYFVQAKCHYLYMKFGVIIPVYFMHIKYTSSFNACIIRRLIQKKQSSLNAVLAEFDEITKAFKYSVVFSTYAEVLTLDGKYDEAIKKLEIALRLNSKDPDLCLQMAKILFKATKNIEHLYEWCFKALEIDCRCNVALEILALILVNFGCCRHASCFFLFASNRSMTKIMSKTFMF